VTGDKTLTNTLGKCLQKLSEEAADLLEQKRIRRVCTIRATNYLIYTTLARQTGLHIISRHIHATDTNFYSEYLWSSHSFHYRTGPTSCCVFPVFCFLFPVPCFMGSCIKRHACVHARIGGWAWSDAHRKTTGACRGRLPRTSSLWRCAAIRAHAARSSSTRWASTGSGLRNTPACTWRDVSGGTYPWQLAYPLI